MTSLRRRLLIGTVAIAAAVLASSSLLAWLLTRAAMDHEFDSALRTQVRALTTMVIRNQRQLRIEYDAYLMPEYSRDERPELFCFWDYSGNELLRSPALATQVLAVPAATTAQPQVSDRRLPDGRPGRMAVLAFHTPQVESESGDSSSRHHLIVAALRDTLDRDHRLTELALILAAATAIGTAVAVAAMAWLSQLLLRPVSALAGRIATIDADRLTERIGTSGVPAELVPSSRGSTTCSVGSMPRSAASARSPPTPRTNCAHRLPDCAPRWRLAPAACVRQKSTVPRWATAWKSPCRCRG